MPNLGPRQLSTKRYAERKQEIIDRLKADPKVHVETLASELTEKYGVPCDKTLVYRVRRELGMHGKNGRRERNAKPAHDKRPLGNAVVLRPKPNGLQEVLALLREAMRREDISKLSLTSDGAISIERTETFHL